MAEWRHTFYALKVLSIMKLHFQLKIVSTRFVQIVVFYYWQSLAPAYDVKMTIVNRDLNKEIYMDE